MRRIGRSPLFCSPYGVKALAFARTLPQNTHLRKQAKTQADFDAIERAEAKRARRAEKIAAAVSADVRHS